jgi:GNAT superfamily N-acetyltransferase
MSALDIRLARPDDAPALVEIKRRASLAGNPEPVRRQLRERPELIAFDPDAIAANAVFVAARGDRLLGFAALATHEGDDAELTDIFVEPAHWREGIGTALLGAILREASAWGANRLHVLANAGALGFYTQHGFVRLGEERTPLGPMATRLARPVAG